MEGQGSGVMRVPVRDGKVSAMGGWVRGPLSFQIELPVWPNETQRA